VSRLPVRTTVSVIARSILLRLRGPFERDLVEQSVAERLAKAALAVGLLWLAIWWALT
jgi:hypothetical protein